MAGGSGVPGRKASVTDLNFCGIAPLVCAEFDGDKVEANSPALMTIVDFISAAVLPVWEAL